MAKKTLLSRFQQPVHPVLAIAVLFCATVLVIAVSFMPLMKFNPFPNADPEITYVHVTPIPNITAAQTVPTVIFNQHSFASPDLGISFDYDDTTSEPFHVQEVGDKVYLNARQDEPPLGKFVEVFSKKPSDSLADSLADAVKKQFLQGYSLDNCPILPANLAKNTLNPARQYVQITTPKMQEYNIRKQLEAEKLCPPTYTYNRRGIVYFMMDQSHHDKFVFFKIGQDNIWGAPPSSNGFGITWDQTLRFTGN